VKALKCPCTLSVECDELKFRFRLPYDGSVLCAKTERCCVGPSPFRPRRFAYANTQFDHSCRQKETPAPGSDQALVGGPEDLGPNRISKKGGFGCVNGRWVPGEVVLNVPERNPHHLAPVRGHWPLSGRKWFDYFWPAIANIKRALN